MKEANSPFTKRGKDYQFKEGMRTLPGKYYHSQEIFQEELEKVFYKKWVLAGRAEEIPEPGDYKLFELGDESLIIARTKSGEVSANFNVCRHRGTRMCVEPKGHLSLRTSNAPIMPGPMAWTENYLPHL